MKNNTPLDLVLSHVVNSTTEDVSVRECAEMGRAELAALRALNADIERLLAVPIRTWVDSGKPDRGMFTITAPVIRDIAALLQKARKEQA